MKMNGTGMRIGATILALGARHTDLAGPKGCRDIARRLAGGLWPRSSASPFRYFPGSPSGTRLIRKARAVADQPAGRDVVAKRIDRGNPVARRQRSELFAPTEQERIAGGLLSYGPNINDMMRGVVVYIWTKY